MAIFDVLKRSPTSSSHPFILEQPQPRLQDVLPNFSPERATAILPNIDSAHVCIVAETGSLFAMSQDRFPLVAFGDSSKDDRGRLIEGARPSQVILPDDPILSRTPKLANLNCRTDVISDRRCLLGVKKIEEGEWPLKRLIEAGRGVPMVGAPVPITSGPIREDVGRNAGGGITDDAPPGAIDADDALLMGRGSTWQMTAVIVAVGVLSAWMTWKRLQNKMTKGITALNVLGTTLEPSQVSLKDLQNSDGVSRLDGAPVEHPRSPTPATPSSDSSSRAPSLSKPESGAVTLLTEADEGDDSDKDGEPDGEVPATPSRRKVRRGKRGKKKKVAIVAQNVDESGRSDGLETPFLQSSPAIPPLSITPSPVSPAVQVGPSLVVSETVLGKFPCTMILLKL